MQAFSACFMKFCLALNSYVYRINILPQTYFLMQLQAYDVQTHSSTSFYTNRTDK